MDAAGGQQCAEEDLDLAGWWDVVGCPLDQTGKLDQTMSITYPPTRDQFVGLNDALTRHQIVGLNDPPIRDQIVSPSDPLTSDQILGHQTLQMPCILHKATHSWLSNEDILAIIRRPEDFGIFPTTSHQIVPQSGQIFFIDKRTWKHFRNDGIIWRTKTGANGTRNLVEAHERLKVRGQYQLVCYYSHAQDASISRRIYSLLCDRDRILVHYLTARATSIQRDATSPVEKLPTFVVDELNDARLRIKELEQQLLQSQTAPTTSQISSHSREAFALDTAPLECDNVSRSATSSLETTKSLLGTTKSPIDIVDMTPLDDANIGCSRSPLEIVDMAPLEGAPGGRILIVIDDSNDIDKVSYAVTLGGHHIPATIVRPGVIRVEIPHLTEWQGICANKIATLIVYCLDSNRAAIASSAAVNFNLLHINVPTQAPSSPKIEDALTASVLAPSFHEVIDESNSIFSDGEHRGSASHDASFGGHSIEVDSLVDETAVSLSIEQELALERQFQALLVSLSEPEVDAGSNVPRDVDTSVRRVEGNSMNVHEEALHNLESKLRVAIRRRSQRREKKRLQFAPDGLARKEDVVSRIQQRFRARRCKQSRDAAIVIVRNFRMKRSRSKLSKQSHPVVESTRSSGVADQIIRNAQASFRSRQRRRSAVLVIERVYADWKHHAEQAKRALNDGDLHSYHTKQRDQAALSVQSFLQRKLLGRFAEKSANSACSDRSSVGEFTQSQLDVILRAQRAFRLAQKR